MPHGSLKHSKIGNHHTATVSVAGDVIVSHELLADESHYSFVEALYQYSSDTTGDLNFKVFSMSAKHIFTFNFETLLGNLLFVIGGRDYRNYF